MSVQNTQTPRGYTPGNVAQAQDAAVFERSGAGVYLTIEWIATYIQNAIGNGSAITFGSTAPANTVGEQDDVFFNIATGEVLLKGASAWSVQANFALDSDVTAAIAAAITAHAGAVDPHPIYLTQAEATALYKPLTTDDSVATGLRFALKTAQTGTPANGEVQFNNATLSSVTQLLIAETGRDGSAIANLLAMLQTTTRIVIQVEQSEGLYAWFNITGAPTDSGTYRTVPVAFVTAPTGLTTVAGLGVAGAELTLDFYGAGGSSGGVGSGLRFLYDTSNTVAEDIGYFARNGASFAAATQLSFSVAESQPNEPPVDDVLVRLTTGAIFEIRKSATAYARYRSTGTPALVSGSVNRYDIPVAFEADGTDAIAGQDFVYLTVINDAPVSGGIIIQDEGVSLGTATTINLAGNGVTSLIDGGVATVTISGGGSGGGGGSVNGGSLLRHTFNGVANTQINGTLSDSGNKTFINVSGNIRISNSLNSIINSATTYETVQILSIGNKYRIKFTANFGLTNPLGQLAVGVRKGNSVSQYYQVYFHGESSELRILHHNDPSYVNVATLSIGSSVNAPTVLEVIVDEDSITATYNGRSLLYPTSLYNTNTGICIDFPPSNQFCSVQSIYVKEIDEGGQNGITSGQMYTLTTGGTTPSGNVRFAGGILYLHESDRSTPTAVNLTTLWQNLTPGSVIQIIDETTPTNYVNYTLGAWGGNPPKNASVYELPAVASGIGGAIASNANVRISFALKGATGAPGSGSTINVQEVDGTPSGAVTGFIFPNSSVSISGGIATIVFPTVASDPLANFFTSKWYLDEASGNRQDSVGTNHLTPFNSPGFDATFNGTLFTGSGNTTPVQQSTLEIATNSTLESGVGLNIYLCALVRFASLKDLQFIISKYDQDTPSGEYTLYLNNGQIVFDLYDVTLSGAAGAFSFAPSLGALSINTNYVVQAWWESATRISTVRIGQAQQSSTPLASGFSPRTTDDSFKIGSVYADRRYGMAGLVKKVGFSRIIPSGAQMDAIWNNGNGFA